MLRLISLLLFPLVAFGQGFTPRRPFVLTSAPVNPNPTNALPTGIYLWWVASDMPTNVTVSNQWLDRVQGKLMGNDIPSRQPTNSLKGVYFDGTKWLTNLPGAALISFGFAVLMIAENDSVSGGQVMIWNNGQGGNQAVGFVFSSGKLYWSYFNGQYVDLQYTRPNNYLNDMLFTPTNTEVHTAFFTNGVSTGVDVPEQNAGSFDISGMGAEPNGTPNSFYHGYIREVIVWTNLTGASWSSGMVSNAHWYATNQYPTITP